VLKQDGKVVAYHSHKFSPAESRYPTHDQEALAVVYALKEWRCYLEGAKHVVCLSDHQPLVHLMSQANLSRRQSRWIEFLSRFNFDIVYQRGVDNGVADALSRYSSLVNSSSVVAAVTRRMLRRAADLSTDQPGVLVPDAELRRAIRQAQGLPAPAPRGEEAQRQREANTQLTQLHAPAAPRPSSAPMAPGTLKDALLRGYASDARFADSAVTREWRLDSSGFWLHDGRIVVPDVADLKLQILRDHHDAPAAGHRGITKTVELIMRTFW
jgi:hypothetical protein